DIASHDQPPVDSWSARIKGGAGTELALSPMESGSPSIGYAGPQRWLALTIASISWNASSSYGQKSDLSPASQASRNPGALRSQSGRIFRVTSRRSWRRSSGEGRPQNQ